ncbi:hypothetical protein evm_007582 [Chilo suppressalis]|nr:hypothetical protein evm_007582 [Chilo suppressalis]
MQLSHLDGEALDQLICATCVSRLRDASAFKRQVLLCEEKLLQSRIFLQNGDKSQDINAKLTVKEELEDCDGESHIDDNVDSRDCNELLTSKDEEASNNIKVIETG